MRRRVVLRELFGRYLPSAVFLLLSLPSAAWSLPFGDGVGLPNGPRFEDFSRRVSSPPRDLNGLKTFNKTVIAQSGRDNERLKNRYEQWQNMRPEEKEEIRRRMDRWNQMPPRERQRYERRYQQWQSLPPEEQGQMKKKLNRWDSLTPDEKESIRNRFR